MERNNVLVVGTDRHLTVTTANSLARRLSAGFWPGENLARQWYLGLGEMRPSPQAEEGDRGDRGDGGDEAALGGAGTAPGAPGLADVLKFSLQRHGEDAPFRRLVGELSALSRVFSKDWADAHPVLPDAQDLDVVHAQFGRLRLRCRSRERCPGGLLFTLAPRDAETTRVLGRLASGPSGEVEGGPERDSSGRAGIL